MILSSVRLGLLIGRTVPQPAPRLLMNALESVRVDNNSDFNQGFTLIFRAERELAASTEYALLNGTLLKPGSRVIITVSFNATPRVLVDGVITHHQLVPSGGKAGTSLTVTGEDLSVLMDMDQVSMLYPPLPHEAIVLMILLKYASFGVMPIIIPCPTSWTTNLLDQMPQQRATDLAYLRELAGKHGYTFGIRPGSAPLSSFAYWGPPDILSQISKICPPQKPLTVDMGPASNVQSINFSYNALAPERVHGWVADPDFLLPIPVMTLLTTRIPPLASQPPLVANPSFVKKTLLGYDGHQVIEAFAEAQSRTNQSSDQVVSASGTLDTLRYGGLLNAPGYVGLRGAGHSYDGYYYVKSVSHTINRKEYKQSFTLSREGIGSLAQRV